MIIPSNDTGNHAGYRAAATYTGKSIADGGRLTVVAPCGKRHDLIFNQAGSAFDYAERIATSPQERKDIAGAILDALRIAIMDHFAVPHGTILVGI